MSAFKRINVADSFVVPYTANKSWDILSSSFAEKQISVNIGVKSTSSIFNPNGEYNTNDQYDSLVYDSINTIYYPNFLPRTVDISSKISTIYNNGTLSTSSYHNGFVELGNIDTIKHFPTESGDVIYVLNIPRQVTGDGILPTTFELYFNKQATCEEISIENTGFGPADVEYVLCGETGYTSETILTSTTVYRCIDNSVPINVINGTVDTASIGSCTSSLSTYSKIYDDGNYNLFYSGSTVDSSIDTFLSNGSYVGNVFYEQNIAVLTVIPNNIRLTGWRGADPYCLQSSPSPTPSITPSITTTPSVTPSLTTTPSITVTPSVTTIPPASISSTPSITTTPSITPSLTTTPSITPTITPSTSPCTCYETIEVNITSPGTITYDRCNGGSPVSDLFIVGTIFIDEPTYCINTSTLGGTATYTVLSYVLPCCGSPVPSVTPTPTLTPTPSVTPSTPSAYNFQVYNTTTGGSINNVNPSGPAFYLISVNSLPVGALSDAFGTQGGYAGKIFVDVTGPSGGGQVKVYKNGSLQETQAIGSGVTTTLVFNNALSYSFSAADEMKITLET